MVGVSNLSRQLVRRQTVQAMTALVKIVRPGGDGYDPDTNRFSVSEFTTVYRGKARIRTVGDGGVISVGGAEIVTRRCTVSIPIETAVLPHRDDILQVLDDSAADQDLTTDSLRILGVDGGGLFGDARRMSAIGWYPSTYWGKQ